MNDGGSIVEFFYNVIPGSLFLFLLKYFSIFDISWFFCDSIVVIFTYIVVGLFLGFVFQGMTKLTRKYIFKWNYHATESVLKKVANLDKFEPIYKKLQKEDYNSSDKDKILSTFYFMDNFLRGEKAAFLPTHFSSRFAFWSNIFFAFAFLIIIRLFNNRILDWNNAILAVFVAGSFYFAKQYLEGFYDTILKSYFMLKVKKNG